MIRPPFLTYNDESVPAAQSILDRPGVRRIVSVAAAVAVHGLILAAVWPWVKPFVLGGPISDRQLSNRQRIDRRAIESSARDMPIISGDITNGSPSIDEPSYASVSWDITPAVAPAAARLPFSYATPLNPASRGPISAPRRVLIAPGLAGPTIGP